MICRYQLWYCSSFNLLILINTTLRTAENNWLSSSNKEEEWLTTKPNRCPFDELIEEWEQEEEDPT